MGRLKEESTSKRLDVNALVQISKSNNSMLGGAFLISVMIHLGVVMLKLPNAIEHEPSYPAPFLDVLLINAATESIPQEVDFVAQSDSSGGGDIFDEKVYATSPAEFYLYEDEGISQPFIASLYRQNIAQTRLIHELENLKDALALLISIDSSDSADKQSTQAAEARRSLLTDKIAAIEQKIQEENSRPHRRYIGPATKSHAQAVYYESIRLKIEHKGTDNFPQKNGEPLYGSMVFELVISAEGDLRNIAILETSGQALLDRQAQAIVSSAAPFAVAPAELLLVGKEIEFVFVLRFKFMNDGHVETALE